MHSPVEALVHRHLPKESELLDGGWCHVGSHVLRLDVDEAVAHMPLALEHRQLSYAGYRLAPGIYTAVVPPD